jgi:uncharacterized protein YjbI with pentapeptide repeats
MAHVIRNARLPGIAFFAVVLGLTAAGPASADSLVRVTNLKLTRSAHRVAITGTIRWNAAAAEELTVGEVRLVGVDRDTRRATVVRKRHFDSVSDHPVADVRFVLRSNVELSAVRLGNRIVLTATQHPPNPSRDVPTEMSFVTVGQVEPGPPTDRVGRKDCSDQPVRAGASLQQCDLVGAYLARAGVGSNQVRTPMELADLSAADLTEADLSRIDIAGGRINDADASGATNTQASFRHTEGLGFIERDSTIVNLNAANARLIDANFDGTTFTDAPNNSSFFTATLDGASFEGGTLNAVNFVTARLVGANLRGATLTLPDLTFANLTDAHLRGATFITDQGIALQWALLCRTEMPTAEEGDKGTVNRDCTG